MNPFSSLPQRSQAYERKHAAGKAAKKERVKRAAIRGAKPLRDPAFLAWLRHQWCIVCEFRTGSEAGTNHIEAAHVGIRGLRQKSSDREAVPLCVRHHRTGKDSHHVLGKRFWTHHHLDKGLILAALHARYEYETRLA